MSAASQKKGNLRSFRFCSPEHSPIQQLYLDRAESCLQAPYSSSQAASRKGARGAPDSGACRALRAALGTDGAACPALTAAFSLQSHTVPQQSLTRPGWGSAVRLGSGALHAQPDTAATRAGACQPRGAPSLQLSSSPCGWAPTRDPRAAALRGRRARSSSLGVFKASLDGALSSRV